jgi:hypothetical protein
MHGLCRHFRTANGTCLQILHDTLGMEKFHFCWVPHAPNTNQKAERVTLSRGIFSVLQGVRSTGFHSVIAGDKLWFFPCYPSDLTSALSRDEVQEIVSQKIDTEKCLISLLWSANGIHSLADVPKGSTYNSAFSCDPVVPCLLTELLYISEEITQRLCVHRNSACPHDARRSTEYLHTKRIQRTRHPAYSSDLALSDFFLFGYIKRKLIEYDISD